jgi:hypothetical protein
MLSMCLQEACQHLQQAYLTFRRLHSFGTLLTLVCCCGQTVLHCLAKPIARELRNLQRLMLATGLLGCARITATIARTRDTQTGVVSEGCFWSLGCVLVFLTGLSRTCEAGKYASLGGVDCAVRVYMCDAAAVSFSTPVLGRMLHERAAVIAANLRQAQQTALHVWQCCQLIWCPARCCVQAFPN